MSLTLEHFSKAVTRLEEGINRYMSDPEDNAVSDSLVKRFEFTYELAFKMLRRALQRDLESAEAVAMMSFAEVIRWGWSRGLLSEDVTGWKQFRRNRNRTSYMYDEANAIGVCEETPRFLAEAKFLLSQLEKRNDDDSLD